MSYRVLNEKPLKLRCINGFSLYLRLLFNGGVTAVCIFGVLRDAVSEVIRVGFDFNLIQAPVIFILSALIVCASAFHHEKLELDGNKLTHTLDFCFVVFFKKTYITSNIYNLNVNPNINHKSIFDCTGLDSEAFRLSRLGGSVFFEYGPFRRPVFVFKCLDENKASQVVQILARHMLSKKDKQEI